MLDLRGVSSGGGTSLTNIATILLGNDGQTVAGVPITSGATLAAWGALTTIADTIKEVQMQSLDQLDDINAEDFSPGSTSLLGIIHFWENLPYKSAARVLKMAQNTGGANNIGYYIDNYSNPGGTTVTQNKRYGNPVSKWIGSTTYGGALVALTWKQQSFAPSPQIPAGKYAIQGAIVNALTNYALLRFRHADFANFAPGFPVVDQVSTAVARANVNAPELFSWANGYQFTALSEILGVPCEPVFTVSPQGTGLQLEMASLTTDTPVVTLNLCKVG